MTLTGPLHGGPVIALALTYTGNSQEATASYEVLFKDAANRIQIVDVGDTVWPVFYVEHLSPVDLTNKIVKVFPSRPIFPLPLTNYVGAVELAVRAVGTNGLRSAWSEPVNLENIDTRQTVVAPASLTVRANTGHDPVDVGFFIVPDRFTIEASEDLRTWSPVFTMEIHDQEAMPSAAWWQPRHGSDNKRFWRLTEKP